MKRIRWYTLVGFYDDNNQPIVEWRKATSPEEAAKAVIRAFTRKGYQVYVVEAFEGRIKSCLGNDEIL